MTPAGPRRASVVATGADGAATEISVGQQVTFGRDRSADVRFPDEARLSRLAGSIRALSDGVAITNLSATHDLFVRSDTGTGTVRLATSTPGQPVASLLLTGGTTMITWPGAGRGVAVSVEVVPVDAPVPARPVHGRSTGQPLVLNTATKEFAVALLLCRPRLEAVPGAMSTPSVPELTRRLLVTMSSFRLLTAFDGDPATRNRLTGRVHEHLKNLRLKIIRTGLAPAHMALSPETIADVLVTENTIRASHLRLLTDPGWLTAQEQDWET